MPEAASVALWTTAAAALVRPDGTVHFVEPEADPPLGAWEPAWQTVEWEVPEGSLLVRFLKAARIDADRGNAPVEAVHGSMRPARIA